MQKVYAALKPKGIFILDVFTPRQFDGFRINMTVAFENDCFWKAEPHLYIKKEKRYAGNNFLEQYTIVTKSELKSYNIWNHAFTENELKNNLLQVGFQSIVFLVK